jgi:hypothetical protein
MGDILSRVITSHSDGVGCDNILKFEDRKQSYDMVIKQLQVWYACRHAFKTCVAGGSATAV